MLEEKITEDYKFAVKAKDALRVSTLSFLRSQLNYARIDKKADKLNDSDVIAVIKKQIKQRQDSIAQFAQGGRGDLVQKETQEMEILKSYLPAEMSAQELNAIIAEAIKETGATSPKDMGKVMKVVVSKVAGKADGKLVSDLVKEALGKI